MKDFIWRMRTTAVWFLAALAIFTGAYCLWVYSNVHVPKNGGDVECLDGISPIVVSFLVAFVFFFLYAKRYFYDEAYLYGETRKEAFGAAFSGAAIYAVIFAFYVLGLALLVRRSILSMPDVAVSIKVYDISPAEIFYNFAYLVIINLIAYETANLLRKFKSWKFWLVAIISFGLFAGLGTLLMLTPDVMEEIGYWGSAFLLFVTMLIVMTAGDIFMTRGRQYR